MNFPSAEDPADVPPVPSQYKYFEVFTNLSIVTPLLKLPANSPPVGTGDVIVKSYELLFQTSVHVGTENRTDAPRFVKSIVLFKAAVVGPGHNARKSLLLVPLFIKNLNLILLSVEGS